LLEKPGDSIQNSGSEGTGRHNNLSAVMPSKLSICGSYEVLVLFLLNFATDLVLNVQPNWYFVIACYMALMPLMTAYVDYSLNFSG